MLNDTIDCDVRNDESRFYYSNEPSSRRSLPDPSEDTAGLRSFRRVACALGLLVFQKPGRVRPEPIDEAITIKLVTKPIFRRRGGKLFARRAPMQNKPAVSLTCRFFAHRVGFVASGRQKSDDDTSDVLTHHNAIKQKNLHVRRGAGEDFWCGAASPHRTRSEIST